MEFSVGKIVLILLIVVLVFGTGKLPRIGEDLAKGLKGFRDGLRSANEDRPSGHDQ